MANKKILYVAHGGEDLDDGLSYAIYLAKTLAADLQVMVVNSRPLTDLFNEMTDVRCEDQGHSRQERPSGGLSSQSAALYAAVRDRCRQEGVLVSILAGPDSTVSAVSRVVAQKGRLEMVLLSPSLTARRSMKKDLLDVLPRPVITMVAGQKA